MVINTTIEIQGQETEIAVHFTASQSYKTSWNYDKEDAEIEIEIITDGEKEIQIENLTPIQYRGILEECKKEADNF